MVRLVERLMTVDKVDIVLSPWGTGPNLQAAPMFAKYGYPQIMGTRQSDKIPELVQRFPIHVLVPGHAQRRRQGAGRAAVRPEEEGPNQRQGGPVRGAASLRVGVRDARQAALDKAGFKLVYETTYPLGVSDLSAQIKAAKAADPDTMIAFSYPPDTFMLTEQSIANDFNPKVKFLGVGVAFPELQGQVRRQGQRHLRPWRLEPQRPRRQGLVRAPQGPDQGQEPDRWASSNTYAGAAGRCSRRSSSVGEIDRRQDRRGASRPAPSRPSSATPSSTAGVLRKVWWVGQWQDGEYQGIAPTDLPGASKPRPEVAYTSQRRRRARARIHDAGLFFANALRARL